MTLRRLTTQEAPQNEAPAGSCQPLDGPRHRLLFSHGELFGVAPDGTLHCVKLDSDRQHRLVRARVKLAGKTPENSPALFKDLEDRRCLAAGTMIEMAKGGSVAIETIRAGAQVFSPYDQADHALAVMDTTKGTESIPMIRIQDEHGRSLLLTQTHLVQLPGRGMVMSKSLNVGDMVMTKEGPSRLVHVSRERFTGTVHNLKVGDNAELARLAKDQTAMYANGFLVGDTQIQKARETSG